MIHLNSLSIQNYRLFEDLKIDTLGDVNLLVGRNNCGKSTVLEAVRVHAAAGKYSTLKTIAHSRDEDFNDLSVFFNRNVPHICAFCIQNFTMTHGLITAVPQTTSSLTARELYFTSAKEIYQLNTFGAQVYRGYQKEDEKEKTIHRYDLGEAEFYQDVFKRFPCSFVPSTFLKSQELSEAWDNATLANHPYIDALKIIEPLTEGVSFIAKSKDEKQRYPLIKLKNIDPIPLKSMGDGMLRILQIALKIHSAKNGFLLIDEFENGLHYSIQDKVWQMLFHIAREHNIQVFATTHSRDAVESFARIAYQDKQTKGIICRLAKSLLPQDNEKIVARIYKEEELARLPLEDDHYDVR
jgi:ABC-type cobalamin/Fe3+-siderophores transport system ATPase subunit